MRPSQKRAIATHRRRLRRRGIARIEVRLHKDDVPLLRGVIRALADPQRAPETRKLLRERVGALRAVGFKEWLSSAPLEDIELSRDRDTGRDVDL